MSRSTRDIVVFFAGIAAWETLGHWWLGLFGQDLLPMNLGWFTWTQPMNLVTMVVWPVVFVALAYMAWFRREKPSGVTRTPTTA